MFRPIFCEPMKSYRIATIPGDGIGQEVVPQGIRVLNAAGRKFGINFDWDHLPWSCEFYRKTGTMMPQDGLDRIRDNRTIFIEVLGLSRQRSASARLLL